MGPWGFNWFGLFMVVIGVLFLLHNLGYIAIRFDLIWPIFLIIFGLGMMFGWRRRGMRGYWMGNRWQDEGRPPQEPPK